MNEQDVNKDSKPEALRSTGKSVGKENVSNPSKYGCMLILLKLLIVVFISGGAALLAVFGILYGRIRSFNNGEIFKDFDEIRAWATLGILVFCIVFFLIFSAIYLKARIFRFLKKIYWGQND